jgi:small GTP-binding protein
MRTLNLGILAHVDAGKTTLTERLLFTAGAIDRVGSVDAGTTQTDSLELERERGITIRSAVASFQLPDLAVNIVDTPGHPTSSPRSSASSVCSMAPCWLCRPSRASSRKRRCCFAHFNE